MQHHGVTLICHSNIDLKNLVWAKSCLGYILETVRCRILILGMDIG